MELQFVSTDNALVSRVMKHIVRSLVLLLYLLGQFRVKSAVWERLHILQRISLKLSSAADSLAFLISCLTTVVFIF